MSETIVFRVQDSDGRGPYKPGFSHKWLDEVLAPGRVDLPSWIAEFGKEILLKDLRPDEHFGCGCESPATLKRWFSQTEMERLKGFGYGVVMMPVDRVLARSKNQTVFARKTPLKQNVIHLTCLYQLGVAP